MDLFPPIPLAAGDGVLLCSDGLTGMLSDADILALVGDGATQRETRRLIVAANRQGGVDNISVVLARVGGRLTATPVSAQAGQGIAKRRWGLTGKQFVVIGALFAVLLLVLMGIGWAVVGGWRAQTASPVATGTPQPVVGVTAAAPTTTLPASPTSSMPRPVGGPTSTLLPTQTATSTPEPSAPATTAVTIGVPDEATLVLQSPAQGLSFKNPIHFAWKGELTPGQSYQLTVWHEETGYEKTYPAQDGAELYENLPAERAGQWLWAIKVVEGPRVVAETGRWHFYLVPFDISTAAPTLSPAPERP